LTLFTLYLTVVLTVKLYIPRVKGHQYKSDIQGSLNDVKVIVGDTSMGIRA